jgi:hypothetical protein
MRVGVFLAVLIIFAGGELRAQPTDFNTFMVKAQRKIIADPARAYQGYSLGGYFTQDLKYGTTQIKANPDRKPRTMCNAAATETLIQAIELYREDNTRWSPEAAMPAKLWEDFTPTTIKYHLFSHDLLEYPPLQKIPRAQIPQGLRKEIEDFQSKNGMAFALEKLGIGQRVEFRNAKPGDIITFDRTNDTVNGKEKYSGHSVVMLGFLNKKQEVTDVYDPAEVVGFKYFSSQGGGPSNELIAALKPSKPNNANGGGLDVRWAYFRGFCPLKDGYQLPSDPAKAGCADRINNAANRAKKTPPQNPDHITDCCLNKPGTSYGPRVGRVFSPERWNFNASQQRLTQQYATIQAHIREFLKNRENANVRVTLIAKGAVAAEASRPEQVAPVIDRVNRQLGLDLRAIARGGAAPAVTPAQANQLAKAVPRSVIVAANRQVTTDIRNSFQSNVASAVNSAIADLQTAETSGVPNPNLDSSDID